MSLWPHKIPASKPTPEIFQFYPIAMTFCCTVYHLCCFQKARLEDNKREEVRIKQEAADRRHKALIDQHSLTHLSKENDVKSESESLQKNNESLNW